MATELAEELSQLAGTTEANPLRKWRHKWGVTIVDICALIGTTSATLQKWEKGVSKPPAHHMDKIRRLTKNNNIEKEWDEWLTTVPRL